MKHGTITPTCWEANAELLKDVIVRLHYLPRVPLCSLLFLPALPCRPLLQAAHVAALNVPRHVLFTLTYTCLWSHFPSAAVRSSSKVLLRCSRYLFFPKRSCQARHILSQRCQFHKRLTSECSRKEEKFTLLCPHSINLHLRSQSWRTPAPPLRPSVIAGNLYRSGLGSACSYWSPFFFEGLRRGRGRAGHVDLKDKAECMSLESLKGTQVSEGKSEAPHCSSGGRSGLARPSLLAKPYWGKVHFHGKT